MFRKYIPDGFWHSESNGVFVSHEAVCILNTHPHTVHVELTLYFEDRDKISGFHMDIASERTKHIRMDQIMNDQGICVPQNTPYAIVVDSSHEVQIQYSRVDTSQAEMAVATTMV